MTKSLFRNRLGGAAIVALAVALAGCGQRNANDSQMTAASLPALPATLPLAAGPSTGLPSAPPVSTIPRAAPIRTVRVADPGQNYAYAEAAYDNQNAIGGAPPDYSFAYGGVRPWAWESYDQSVVFVEPLDRGYRYYYYRPGADQPYFVRDPDYGYGFADGQLAAVYSSVGAALSFADYESHRDYAARYLWRAQALYNASQREQRFAVNAADWAARSASISAAQAQWALNRERQTAWYDYQQQRDSSEANYWHEEAIRRQADSQRFATWRDDGFRAAPPPRAIPAIWAAASWARDTTRFEPARADRTQLANNAQPQRDANRPQGLFGGRFDGQPANQPAPTLPQASAPDRNQTNQPGGRPIGAMSGARNRDFASPGRFAPDQAPIAQPQANRPQGDFAPNVDNRRVQAELRRNQATPGNARRFQPQPQPNRVAPSPPAQPRSGGGRPNAIPQTQPRPQVVAPRPQPQGRFGGNPPAFRTPQPHAQAIQPPHPEVARSQAPRPSVKPRAPQAAAPRPEPAPRAGGKPGNHANPGDRDHRNH